MKSEADKLIAKLEPEINKKCSEIQTLRKERIQVRIFILLCAMIIIIPALLVFAGISLTVLIAPLLFMSLSIIILLPVLINNNNTANQGGTYYE